MLQARRNSTRRVHLPPPRSPEAQLMIQSGVLKNTPEKMAFFVDYSNAVYAGEIGRGKQTSKIKTEELATKHNVRHPNKYFEKLKKQFDQGIRFSRKERTGDGMILEKTQ